MIASHSETPNVAGVAGEAVERRRADAAPGLVDDPPQRDLVVEVVEHLQVGDQILDLSPLVELGPAHHAIVDALAREQVLQHPHWAFMR